MAQDTFIRSNTAGNTTISNVAGWGTASDGEAWAGTSTAYTYSIASNAGKVTGSTGVQYGLLGSNAQLNGYTLVRAQCNHASDYAGVIMRFTTALGPAGYRAYWGVGDTNLYLDRVGVAATLSTVTITAPVINTKYWIKLDINGTVFLVKFWADGSAEPGTWNITSSDSTIITPQLTGLVWNANTSTDTIQFDSFSSTSSLKWRFSDGMGVSTI